jgi:hypothetical protein
LLEAGEEERAAIAYLRTPGAIRERCGRLLDHALAGDLEHFAVHLDRLPEAAARVADVTRRAYPDLDIPWHSRWRHFGAGGVDRLAMLDERLAALDRAEQARARFDLVVTSVLLDAGAGSQWRYREEPGSATFSRSEGLAVASFQLYMGGAFSGDAERPLEATSEGLEALSEDDLARGFQVSTANPLAGLGGRAALLRRLGATMRASPEHFGSSRPRPGGLYDHIVRQAHDGTIPAATVLLAVLEGLGPIWPDRISLGGVNLGDVWRHEKVGGAGPGAGLVPLHKLSQWLTYSLIEPLEWSGVRVTGVEALTGLAEYRNGGLLLDMGVIEAKHARVTGEVHPVDSAVVVEWRALTVVLLDRLAQAVRRELAPSADVPSADLPLARILEGGTWRAGRELAQERRPQGEPPILVASDGTVF